MEGWVSSRRMWYLWLSQREEENVLLARCGASIVHCPPAGVPVLGCQSRAWE